MQHLRERKIASIWFGAFGLVSAFVILLVTLYLLGNKPDIDSFYQAIILGALLIAAVLGFLFGYKILLLKSSKTSIVKTVLYGVFGGLLVLLILGIGIVLFINYLAQLHGNSDWLSFGFFIMGFSFFMFGGPVVGVGIISALLLYYFRSRDVSKS